MVDNLLLLFSFVLALSFAVYMFFQAIKNRSRINESYSVKEYIKFLKFPEREKPCKLLILEGILGALGAIFFLYILLL